MQSNFLEYLRQQTIKQTMVVFAFASALTIILLIVLYQKESQEEGVTDIFNLLILHTGTITLTMGMTVFSSLKYPKLAECIGVAVMLPTMIILYASNLSDKIEMTTASRTYQTYFMALQFFIVTNYMAVDYVTHLIIREIFFWSWLILVAIKRHEYDGHNIGSSFAFGILFNLIFESLLYSNHRAKATLFMQVKVTA